jgi:hypothetical protein
MIESRIAFARPSMTKETYFVTDIEADGPIPGPYSMRSLASVAYDAKGQRLDTWTANLRPLPDATTHPVTMKWWEGFPQAWAACQVDAREPRAALADYAAWVSSHAGRPVFVAFPATFDFMWVQWYLVRLLERSPFSPSAIDIKTLVMIWLGSGYSDAVKARLPPEWTAGLPHTHVALDDALEQGELFRHLLSGIRARLRPRNAERAVGNEHSSV